MIRKKTFALITLALAACVSTAFAQTLVWSWDHTTNGWSYFGAQMTVTNGQLVFSGSFSRADTNNPFATFAGTAHSLPTSGPLPNNQTLEARVDLVGANQNDAWAGINFWWDTLGTGYIFWKDPDEVGLLKYYNGNSSLAWFFYQTNQPIKNQNVTLVFALTRLDPNLRIDARVLDKDNNNALLFEHTVIDTPQADPVVPMGAPDLPGTPWPAASEPGYLCLNLEWTNPEHAPQGGVAQVIFDNVEVRQYESPQLTIQNAVVLSWPVTAGQFVLDSASSVTGPWAPVPDPWWRTNAGLNQVSILAPDSGQFFRLRLGP
jgi:hypothetical protein